MLPIVVKEKTEEKIRNPLTGTKDCRVPPVWWLVFVCLLLWRAVSVPHDGTGERGKAEGRVPHTPPTQLECALATHPAAVLISFAWLRKVLHCVVAVAVQRKQGDA